MGYTHYWRGKIDASKWGEWCDIVNAILVDDSVVNRVCREHDRVDELPEVSATLVAFNGKSNDGHETFYVTPMDNDFEFCKTAHKPYDRAVTACLIAMKALMDNVTISSDGRAMDWEAGLDLLHRAAPYMSHITLETVEHWLKH